MKAAGKIRRTKAMGNASIDWNSVRKELAEKRAELFNRFVRHPENIRLAVEIKHLDDQLVECHEHMAHARKRSI